MKRYLKDCAYGAWLGYSLVILGHPLDSWEFYFVLVPTAVLVTFLRGDPK